MKNNEVVELTHALLEVVQVNRFTQETVSLMRDELARARGIPGVAAVESAFEEKFGCEGSMSECGHTAEEYRTHCGSQHCLQCLISHIQKKNSVCLCEELHALSPKDIDRILQFHN